VECARISEAAENTINARCAFYGPQKPNSYDLCHLASLRETKKNRKTIAIMSNLKVINTTARNETSRPTWFLLLDCAFVHCKLLSPRGQSETMATLLLHSSWPTRPHAILKS